MMQAHLHVVVLECFSLNVYHLNDSVYETVAIQHNFKTKKNHEALSD